MKKLITMLLVFTLCLSMLPITAKADNGKELTALKKAVKAGTEYTNKDGSHKSIKANEYKVSGGGAFTYSDLVTDKTKVINTARFEKLKPNQKTKFLTDVFRVANAMAYYEIDGVDSSTVSDLYDEMQGYTGVGSHLIASLLTDYKPDYARASDILKPMTGIIGTALGILSILILSLLGLTMAVDICYLTIPAFKLIVVDEKEGNGKGWVGLAASKIVSKEAIAADKSNEGGGNGNGGFKSSILTYFSYRWKGLLVLAICLLYLVQGQIWSFVAWLIDLGSGFLGF